ncbi:Helicase conserved C-terminal domain-containing protein [Microbacterium sp. ru370.1]|uniref:DEAD/DEAH box helicase n=1 Tax=unclassified Microbacterium TaxID=2609290 RepID=UPI0008920F87|nr:MULTISPECIES: DEAD/DEAH box helicase [unclassified Microbacterium]SDO43832.1 Helicase conserved C-terminal domain-containing protein [Microbacterium sp. ru370.1]SIT80757.1 Helicase conserved C-terminal domain-containing protein [Microbacterium sp. RU1D]
MRLDPEALSIAGEMFSASAMTRADRLLVYGSVEVGDARSVSGVLVVAAQSFGASGYEHLELRVPDDLSRLSGWCSCGRGPECEHSCAAALVLFDRLISAGRPPRPEWQRSLDELFSTATAVDDEAPFDLCIFLSIRRGGGRGHGTALTLSARPGVRGSRGTWIKGRAGWSALAALPADPRARAALDSLGRLGRFSSGAYLSDEWMPLSAVPPHSLWLQLEAVVAAGVPLVSGAGIHHPVRIVEKSATAAVSLDRRGSALHVRGTVQGVDAETAALPCWVVGDPAVAVAFVDDRDGDDERITLARLATPASGPVRGLLARSGALTVDERGSETFLRDYLPRLQLDAPVVSPRGTVDVPEAPRPVLEVIVEHREGATALATRWDRSSTRGRRHDEHERAVWAAVSAIAEELRIDVPAPFPTGAAPARAMAPAAAALFVGEGMPRLRGLEHVRLHVTGDDPAYRAASEAPVVQLSTGADDGSDWFDLNARVTVGDVEVDFTALYTALALGDRVLFLGDGAYVRLDTPEFDRLRAVIDEARTLADRPGNDLTINRYNVGLWDDLSELGMLGAHEAEWWLRVRGLTDEAALTRIEPPAGLRATLRDYQRSGLDWLHFLRTQGLGGILADDMGLGKTVQTIAMMEAARVDDPTLPPFLIVAPTSVVGNWARECATFAPDLEVRTISATRARRADTIAEAADGAHVVVTSYALFRLEQEQYAEAAWSGLVLDEAQQIKNPSSRGYRAARALAVPFTLVITGTPMENNLLELWALMSLVAPGLLGTRESFTELYRTPIEKHADAERLDLLRRRIRPFLLRRTKDLVAAELPPKQETIIEVALHPAHRKLYDRRFHRERQRLLGLLDDDAEGNRFAIFRSLTMLRQLALDPALVDEGDAPSAKLDALEDLLVEAEAEGHRVLVLSQFTRFLRAARQRCTDAGLASGYLDGTTVNRQAEIDRFRDGSDPAFFVSLKAGGVGLNLVEADYVVLLDPWWNPAVEEQAIDRAHRIGQTRPVIVYRLVSSDTVEEKVVALRQAKADLFSRVLDEDADEGGGAFAGGPSLTADDIRSLLD